MSAFQLFILFTQSVSKAEGTYLCVDVDHPKHLNAVLPQIPIHLTNSHGSLSSSLSLPQSAAAFFWAPITTCSCRIPAAAAGYQLQDKFTHNVIIILLL
jgi:hypothetical protein